MCTLVAYVKNNMDPDQTAPLRVGPFSVPVESMHTVSTGKPFKSSLPRIARRLSAKFWPDCAIPDTSMKFDTVVDHD